MADLLFPPSPQFQVKVFVCTQKKLWLSSSSSSKSCLIIFKSFVGSWSWSSSSSSFSTHLIHFIPIQLSRAWTIRNKRRIGFWKLSMFFQGDFSLSGSCCCCCRCCCIELERKKHCRQMDFETTISSECATRCPFPRPTDWPHKLWILKWISKIKVQTIEKYSSRRRRRRRRLYHLLQCPACMLSFGMSIDQLEDVIWH